MSVIEMRGMPIGSYAPDFELPGTDTQVHHLSKYLEIYRSVVVVFLSNQCPYVQSYLQRLKQLQANWQERGFAVIGINANDTLQAAEESLEHMRNFADRQQLNFPYLRDVNQDVAKCFGAKKTPEAFLVNQQGVLCYKGAIDDCPDAPSEVTQNHLQDAVALVIAGQTVETPQTEAIGSSILWRGETKS
jgi:peroxiredoxin